MSNPPVVRERSLLIDCDEATLIGVLHEPVPATQGAAASHGVVIVVGGPQYRVGSHRQFVLLARDLASAGIPVLRFDYRGMGDSDGEYRGFEHVSADITAAAAAFRRACPAVRDVVLWGLCDGATAATFHAAEAAHEVAGLMLVNPWVRTEQGLAQAYVRSYYGRRLLQWSFWRKLLRGEMQVMATLRGFLGDVQKARGSAAVDQPQTAELPVRMRRALTGFPGPVLLILSGKDLTAREFVACTTSGDWQAVLARQNVRRLDHPEADHTFSRRAWHDRMSADCVDWLRSW